jgi:hypothetical protein
MRKIDNDLLLDLFKRGVPQKAIAAKLGVTPAAVCKKLKRLLPIPKSFQRLTDKQKQFVALKPKGLSATKAALESYNCKDVESAKVVGSKLMAKPEIQQSIRELMDTVGLTRRYRLSKLRQHVDNVDPTVSLRALDLSFKLDGYTEQEDKRPVIYITSEKLAILNGAAQLVRQYEEGKLNWEEYEHKQNLIAGQQEEPTDQEAK